MPAIYKAGVVQVVPQYDIGRPSRAANVLHLMGGGTGYTLSQLQAVQAAFDPAWSTLWRPVGSSSAHYVGSIVTDMSSNTGLQVDNHAYSPVAGVATGGPVGENTAALISLRTGVRYRGGHGRVYLPGLGIGATNNDGENLNTTLPGLITTNWNALAAAMSAISSLNGGPYNFIVWQKKLSTAPNSVQIVTSITPQNQMASQRRRLRKVARHHRRV